MRIRWKRRGTLILAIHEGIEFGTISKEKAQKGSVYNISFWATDAEIRLANFTKSKNLLKGLYIDWIKETYRKIPRIKR